MKKINLILLQLLFLIISAVASEKYYVSSSVGNDKNPGTEEAPLQTLKKISSIKLKAGDQVFFKRGDRFDGHFVVNGSGKKGKEIVISSYGDGALPIITGEVGKENGGDYQEAILIKNQSHIIIEYLEIHNERLTERENVRSQDAFGIYVLNNGVGSIENFTFRHLTFKKVYAPQPVLKEKGEKAFNGLEVAALRFFSTRNMNPSKMKNIKDVLMEECYFEDVQRLGVHIKHGGSKPELKDHPMNFNENFIFRNNEFHHTGGTCILPIRTNNVLIEKNLFNYPGDDSDPRMPHRGSAVWTWRCKNTVIQYNDCLHIRGYLDSHGVHIDHENLNTFIQYNYMEDCEGGFVEILGGNVNSVYRYNVSVNDGWRENPKWKTSNHTLWINYKIPNGEHYCENSYVYNNSVYVDQGFKTSIDMKGKKTYIFNNIFDYAKGEMGTKQMMIDSRGTTFFLSNNAYHGIVANRFTSKDLAPIFMSKVYDKKGNFMMSEDGNDLSNGIVKFGPKVVGAGKGVFAEVAEFPKVDFFGNPIDYPSGKVAVGAFDVQMKAAKAIELNKLKTAEATAFVNKYGHAKITADTKSKAVKVEFSKEQKNMPVRVFDHTGKMIYRGSLIDASSLDIDVNLEHVKSIVYVMLGNGVDRFTNKITVSK
ncbi:right-handed parallel beta-helix repeat-containing protein [Flammeovirga sp. SubArs3]|uniref:right-handed parallel beta-helix repeat-containing protein n=1 Tax=Flammeovirga sp. SubArs3 TaxID=2995316 RepID=UPI00248CADF3|nr:right-handed parallel beta-helix repeat-containing protein [Flammeovirga sp. SubArs3]